jgi:hypothetical protein
MCGLCGAFADSDHWANVAHDRIDATPRALGQLRTKLANRVLAYYGLSLSDAAGSLLLRSATGRSALLPHLGALWPAADRLANRPCDPLDPGLLAALRGQAGDPR